MYLSVSLTLFLASGCTTIRDLSVEDKELDTKNLIYTNNLNLFFLYCNINIILISLISSGV